MVILGPVAVDILAPFESPDVDLELARLLSPPRTPPRIAASIIINRPMMEQV